MGRELECFDATKQFHYALMNAATEVCFKTSPVPSSSHSSNFIRSNLSFPYATLIKTTIEIAKKLAGIF